MSVGASRIDEQTLDAGEEADPVSIAVGGFVVDVGGDPAQDAHADHAWVGFKPSHELHRVLAAGRFGVLVALEAAVYGRDVPAVRFAAWARGDEGQRCDGERRGAGVVGIRRAFTHLRTPQVDKESGAPTPIGGTDDAELACRLVVR